MKTKAGDSVLDDLMGQKPPQDLDAERKVLGFLLAKASDKIVGEVMKKLTASCFYDPKNRMVFEAMAELFNKSVSIVPVSVAEELRSRGDLDAVGGSTFLASLYRDINMVTDIRSYVDILMDKTVKRDLITASYEILRDSFEDSVSADKLSDDAQTRIAQAIQAIDPGTVPESVDIGSIINSVIDNLQELQSVNGPSGIPSGYPSLDRITQGWQKGTVTIVAARPSVGKTAFVLNVARNAAVEHNIPVAVFSLGMNADRVGKRLITTESGLSGEKIRGSVKLEPFEWEQLEYTLKRLAKAPLYVDDTPDLTDSGFAAKAQSCVKRNGVRLIVVDSLQLMRGPKGLRDNRTQEIAAIMRTFKVVSAKLDVPIIVVSQLNRDGVRRTGCPGKPQLSDLCDSGSIEEYADMVLFLHRPEFAGMSEDPADKEKAILVVAKNSDGEVCDIEMRYKALQVKFTDADRSLDILTERPRVSAASEPVKDTGNFDLSDNPF